MNSILDYRYAWRLLMKSKGYSFMCATVVALSVGLVVFAYSFLYSQLLKPLGFPGSERWYSVQIATAGGRAVPVVDAYTYQEMVKGKRAADHLGAFTTETEDRDGNPVVLSEGQASTPVRAIDITPRLFASTHVPPLLGRTLDEKDALPGAVPVAVLSFDAWQSYFAADRAVIGRTTRINSAPVQIVGVMPRDFFLFQDSEVWRPLQLPNLARPGDSAMILAPMILLQDGQNPEALLNEMQPVVERVNSDFPAVYKAARQVKLYPAHRMVTHAETTMVTMFCVMAAGLALLGCVNISMVFLARLLERSRELALRNALGATRGRILRQCLLETGPIVLIGLIGGWGLAALGVRWARGLGYFFSQTLALGRFPNLLDLRPIDLIIAVMAAIAIWLISTLVPAWRIARREASSVLAGSGKGASARGSNRAVGPIVGLQVLVSSFVLVACGNMVLAINKEVSRPIGLATAQMMLTTYPTVFDGRYSEPTQRLRYWENLAAAIQSRVPGAQAAFSTAPPISLNLVPSAIEGQQETKGQGTLILPSAIVSDNYFDLLGLKLRSGRLFDSTDSAGSLNVAVVDEYLAARYWPKQDVLGKRVQLEPLSNGPWLTIVGIVSGVTGEPYTKNSGALYRPLRQAVPQEFQLLVKLPNASSDSRVALRAAAFSVDRDLPLHNLQMLDVYMEARNLRWTSTVQLFTTVALIGALLAASGLFGLISRSVVQRTQEVGIRRALGATPRQATSMFVRQGSLYLIVAIIGVGLETLLLPVISRNIPNILDRVVLVTLGVVLLNAAVILTASYLPGRRAVVLEPGDALRYE